MEKETDLKQSGPVVLFNVDRWDRLAWHPTNENPRPSQYTSARGASGPFQSHMPIDDEMIVEMSIEGDDLGPVKPVAVIAPLPMTGAGDNDFEDLTRILERVAL